MINKEEEEKEVLSGKGTVPLFIRLARLVNAWNDSVIVNIGDPENPKEWRYMTDKQRAAYLKEMLKEYE